MLEYDKIHMSEGMDVNKTNESWKCIICNYYYFLKGNFRFRPKVCDGCHDFMQKDIGFNNVVIVSVKGYDYKIHFWYMGKGEAINMKNSDLREKVEHYQKITFFSYP